MPGWLRVLQVGAELCEGRVVSVLEGGYDVPALARCVTAHVGQLIDFHFHAHR
jgi:acetoin utilization deacetylase AcuC-like enzyme